MIEIITIMEFIEGGEGADPEKFEFDDFTHVVLKGLNGYYYDMQVTESLHIKIGQESIIDYLNILEHSDNIKTEILMYSRGKKLEML